MSALDTLAAMSEERSRSHPRRWIVSVGIALGALVVAGGLAVAALLLFGRPAVSIVNSDRALAQVRPGGFGARVVFVDARVASVNGAGGSGSSITIDRRGDQLWPAEDVRPGEMVTVTARVASPSWLRWLYGKPVTASLTVEAPSAKLLTKREFSLADHKLPLDFTAPVATVSYSTGGSGDPMVTLQSPEANVNVAVPSGQENGTVNVRYSARSWEPLISVPQRVQWFAPVPGPVPTVAVSPVPGSGSAHPITPIRLAFSVPVVQALGGTMPSVSPPIKGSWLQTSLTSVAFQPASVFDPGAQEKVVLPHTFWLAAPGEVPNKSSSFSFSVASGSVLRAQQILAQLGYLPLVFTPAAGVRQPDSLASEEASTFSPLAGSFSWRWSNTPSSLVAMWDPGSSSSMVQGALMTFALDAGLYVSEMRFESAQQILTRQVWMALLQAALAGKSDPHPYSYVYVQEALPQTLTLWENGSVVLTTLANTGISVDPTATGVYPIYVRYAENWMSGTNPNGSYYHDLVHWINYFNGGDAVHGFVRASYGWPQSLGCVELPLGAAQTAFNDLAVGDLVNVV